LSTASRVIKNTGFLYARMGITMFVSLYTTRLVLNALGATDFGIFNVVGGAIAMLGFLNASMAAATQRFMSYAEGEGKPEKKKSIFNISMVLHVVVAVLAGIALLIAGYFFFNGVLNIPAERVLAAKVVYGSLIVSTMFTVMTVPYDAVLNAHENMKYYAIVGVIESLLKLGIAFVVVYTLSDKLILYGVLMAAEALLVMVIMRIYCHKKYEECVFAPRKYWHKGLMKEMVSFSGWSFLGTGSSMISQYGMGIVLNSFFGAILNAAEGIAYQISGQLMVFSNNMLKAVNPVITKSEGEGNRAFMILTSLRTTKMSFYLLSIFAIPFIIESNYLLGIWLKKVPDWAVVFVQLQLIRAILEQLTVPLSTSIAAQGEIRMYIISVSVINILPIILTYILFLNGFPPYYMFLTFIFGWGIVKGFVTIYYMKKNCGLSLKEYYSMVLIPCVVTSLGMFSIAFGSTYYLPQSFTRLVLVGVVSSATFIIFQRYFFITPSEKQLLNRIYNLTKTKILSIRVK